MSEAHLEMKYPCYFLLRKGNPELIEVDGNTCVCLFTSQNAVKLFYQSENASVSRRNIEVSAIKSQPALIDLLRLWQPSFEEQGCKHIAIDVAPGSPIMYGMFADFIAELERQSPSDD